MKLLDDWVLKRAAKICQTQKNGEIRPTAISTADDLESCDSLNFKLTPANGGVIVSIRKYDRVKDRTYNSLHIITSEQDVATELGKIAALELYKL